MKFLLLLLTLMVAGCTASQPEFGWYDYEGKEPAHQKPYERFGKVYKPIKPGKAANYRERGIASWYGEDFHGLLTSNGETYDMYGYTAAHKTLPLGVFVRVTNLKNGKTSVLRLNDRGPFVDGRVIDVTYSAARELGFADEGITPVDLEVLGFPLYEGNGIAFKQPESYEAASYSLQVASFKVKENAERMAESFRQKSVTAKIVEFRKKDELFYRVRIGSFNHIKDAEQYRETLRKQGLAQSFVVGD